MTKELTTAIANSIRNRWDHEVLSDFQGITLTGREVAQRIEQIHIILKESDIRPGDKIALCARNSTAWATAFLGAMTYGAVVVPLLHEFRPENVEHLVSHSGARILFTEQSIFDHLDENRISSLDGAILIPEMKLAFSRSKKLTAAVENIDSLFSHRFPKGFSPENVSYKAVNQAHLALINYTSGSTGNSKGVMLSYDNLWSNVRFGMKRIDFLHQGDGMLSMLPLAHMYGLVFEFLFPLCKGCHITFLGRVPSPKVVLKAFAEVRPKLVITVPLVIEKIVKGNVFPILRKPMMKMLLAIPGVRDIVYKKVRVQLLEAFGGQLQQLILGGAAVSSDVEEFLRRIKFPFTVGYGMTECAPLVTYEWWACLIYTYDAADD